MSAPQTDKPVLVITGSSGLLGTALSKRFAPEYQIVGLDIYAGEVEVAGVEWILCDMTDGAQVEGALNHIREKYGGRIASVIHLAAYYDFSGDSSPLYQELTVEGTRRLIRGLQDFTVEQFVFSSSLLVMKPVNAQDDRGKLTEDAPTLAEWEYPQSKLDAEKVLETERGEIPVVVMRIAGVYTDECQSLPIGEHIRRIYERELESYLFPGNKEHGQPYIHLDDVVECVRIVVEKRKELDPWELFLIAEPITLSFEDLQEALGMLIHGKEWPTVRVPKAMAKVGAMAKDKLPWEDPFIKPWMIDMADDHYPVEIERARKRLGWEPTHRLDESLGRMIECLKKDPGAFYDRHQMGSP